MKLALVTIVTANLERMRTFYQQVLQIEPQIYRGNYVEFPLEAGTLALWRQSECAEYGLGALRGAANETLYFFFGQIFHLVLGNLGPAYFLRIVDLKSSHLFTVAKKTPEPREHSGHGGWCQ